MYTKIQFAIDNASNGDTIFVECGSYYENLNVNKKLTLQGEKCGNNYPVVDGGGNKNNVFTLNSDGIILNGFDATNTSYQDNTGIYYAGVRLYSDDNTLDNINASGNFWGICIERSNNNTFRNITANGNRDGISTWGDAHLLLTSTDNKFNHITTNNNNFTGIRLSATSNNTIDDFVSNDNDSEGIGISASSNNSIINGIVRNDSTYGIRISTDGNAPNFSSYNNTIKNVEIQNNLYGVHVETNGLQPANCNGNHFINITSKNNFYSGFYLHSVNETIIENSTIIYNNRDGFGLEGAKNNTISNNFFNNTLNVNFISGNSKNAWNTTKQSNPNIIGGNYLGGNYWASPNGQGYSQIHSDSNGDGIIETPYDLGNGNSDYLPLTKNIVLNPLIADFNTNTSAGAAPLAVQFTDMSTGDTPTMWNWSFGDGSWFNSTLSSERNATHVYTITGNYMALLFVTNTSSGEFSVGRRITVTPSPALFADFSTNNSVGIVPVTVAFTDITVGGTPTMWNWSFGDGSWFNTTLESERNPTYIYTSIGTYTVYLTVSNAVSTSTSGGRTITITPTPQLIADFTTNTSAGTSPLTVAFTDITVGGIPTMWNWSFGDGSWFNTTSSSERDPSHIYTTAGFFPTYLTVSDAGYSSTSTNKIINVTITPLNLTSKIGIYRNGVFYLRNSNTGGIADLTFGYGNLAGDIPVTGDWNGDGVDTIGVYRNGVFYLRNSNTNGIADMAFSYGNQAGDIPVVGDWTGSGIDTIGVYRSGVFYLRNSNTGGIADLAFTYGQPGDIPVIGNWTGSGVDTVGVYRNGVFYLRNSNTGGIADMTFGYGNLAGDTPVVGDWTGSGKDTIGVYRNGVFYLRNSNTNGIADLAFTYGQPGDVPVIGDWNGT
jgi:parallel beta-helix repeat protein